METFHCDCGTMHIGGHLGLPCQCLPYGREQEGTPTLSLTTHPIQTGLLCRVGGWLHQLFQFRTGEPTADLFVNGFMIKQRGSGFIAQQGEHLLHVVHINMGVSAARIIEGNRQTWYSMAYEQGEGFLQRVQTAHTYDGIHHTILNQFDDLRESLCHNAETTQLLHFVL